MNYFPCQKGADKYLAKCTEAIIVVIVIFTPKDTGFTNQTQERVADTCTS